MTTDKELARQFGFVLPEADVESAQLSPKASSQRIAVLDIQRGIAILLILLVNITGMGNSFQGHLGDARLLGWDCSDRWCWWFMRLFIDGTQRGLLQFLFGAGALILLHKTMKSDGPVAVADLYVRRNFWLAMAGLFDVFCIFWVGDILFPYGVAALLLFPFRRLSGKALLCMGLVFASIISIHNGLNYHARSVEYSAVSVALTKQTLHENLTKDDRAALAAQTKRVAALQTPAPVVAEERTARLSSFPVYARWLTHLWSTVLFGPYLVVDILEVFFTIILGMALFKAGITQGERSPGFYALLALLCYLPGLTLRIEDALVFTKFQALPNWAAIFAEPARLLVTLGHVALINLLVRSSSGARLLAPLKAVGRTAFSGYLTQNFLGMWILFPAFGFGLYGRYHWFGLTMLSLTIMAMQIAAANLWLHWFAMGPLEWLWRSLAYKRIQRIYHRETKADPVVV